VNVTALVTKVVSPCLNHVYRRARSINSFRGRVMVSEFSPNAFVHFPSRLVACFVDAFGFEICKAAFTRMRFGNGVL
jgi:hypothetical protein